MYMYLFSCLFYIVFPKTGHAVDRPSSLTVDSVSAMICRFVVDPEPEDLLVMICSLSLKNK